MSPITTHVLDLSSGRPARGLAVVLSFHSDLGWTELARGLTDADGRINDLLPAETPIESGPYRLQFDSQGYFQNQGISAFHTCIVVQFLVDSSHGHYHVPLLLSPFGYTTYRGS